MAGTDGGRGCGLFPTGPKDVVDKVDNLLVRDEAIAGVVLAVLEQGTGDVLDTVLGGRCSGGASTSRTKGSTTPHPIPHPPRLQSMGFAAARAGSSPGEGLKYHFLPH